MVEHLYNAAPFEGTVEPVGLKVRLDAQGCCLLTVNPADVPLADYWALVSVSKRTCGVEVHGGVSARRM